MKNASFDSVCDGSNFSEMIFDARKELLGLLEWSVDIMYKRFSSKKIYAKIMFFEKNRKKPDIKAFNYKEQRELEFEINNCFTSFIGNLKKHCPYLTKKEILICCLFLRFHPLTISLCIGYINTNCIKTHKNRIKKKMVELSNHDFLFGFIFK